MEEETIEKKTKTTGKSRVRRIVWGVLLCMMCLFVVLPLSLYIPWVQDIACKALVSYLNDNDSDLEYQVGKIRIGFPLRLQIYDVGISYRSSGDEMIHIGQFQTGLDDIPINQPFFVFNRLHVEDVSLGMDTLTTSFGMSGHLSALDAQRVEYDPTNNQIRVKMAELSEPDICLFIGPSQPDSIDEPSSPWFVSVQHLAVKDGHVGLDMSDLSLADARGRKTVMPYLDYNHLDVTNLQFEADSVHYDPQLIHGRVNHLAATESHSGVEVSRLSANFVMDDRLITLRELDLGLSPNGYLQGDFDLDLALFDSIPSGYSSAQLKASVDSANLVRTTAPYLPGLAQYWPNSKANVEITGRLTPDSLTLPHLLVRVPDHANLTLRGEALNPLNWDSISGSASLQGTLPAADCLLSALVAEPDQRSYRLPDGLEIDAEASRQGSRLTARADLTQADQQVLQTEGNCDLDTEAYHLTAKTLGFNLSEYVPSLVADHFTAHVQADGRHFRFPSRYTRLEADMQIDSLFFRSPDGKLDSLFAVSAQASLLQGHYAATLHSEHPHLQANANLSGTYLPDSISTQGYVDIPAVHLGQLPYGLSQPVTGSLGFSSQVRAFYNGDDIAQINLDIDSLVYISDTKQVHFDDINVHVESEPGLLDAELSGGDASMVISSDCGLRDLPLVLDSLMAEISRQTDSVHFDFEALQRRLPQMSVDFHMARQNPFYQAFEYHTGYSFQSVDLRALNSYRLSLDGQVVRLSDPSGGVDFDTIALNIRPELLPTGDVYRYALHAMHIDPRARDTYDIHAVGQLMPDSVTVCLTYVDGNYLTLYDVDASLAIGEDSLTLHIENDPTLYEQPFTVNPNNYFSLMRFRHLENRNLGTRANLRLKGPRQLAMQLYSRQNPREQRGNQLLFLVRNLDLSYATDVMHSDTDVSGQYNLTSSIDLFPDSLHARLRSGIRDFRLGEFRADTMAFEGVADLAHNLRNFDAQLAVDSIVKLQLEARLADSINVHGWISELPLPLVNAFLPNNIDLSGTTSGRLDMRGRDADHARMNASLSLQEAAVDYKDLDAHLRFSPDTIRLVNNRLQLANYEILGANDKPFRLNGQVDFRKSIDNPTINLQISGQNVRLIDNQRLRLPEQYIYGRLPISPNIKVRGTLSQLQVSGSLNLLSGTDLHYFMSEDPLQSSSRVDQLVEFVNFRQIDRMLAQADARPRPPIQDATDESLDLSMKIEIPADVKVAAHLAGTDNNRVDIVGGGSLSLQTNHEGDLIMNGVYDVRSGRVEYKLPILPMIKTFSISNDSQVSWSANEPGDPLIDIKAVEEVRTTVNDNNGSRIVKFLVTISISGTLDALAMTFDCSAPEDGIISSDLATLDVEERSKAAMMLLVAQTYIGPSNTSSVGLGTANAALNSMLNREMDSMLGNKLKGTNIDLGIDTYSTEAGNARTNYSVKVSQNLFNDRFRATIGGQISSGGDEGQSQGAKLGDMSLEWLIKKDGSHYLKLFRRTNYESVLEGEVIETGVSYIQERSGYRFRQLLLPTNRHRQERIQQMIQELQAKEEEQIRSTEEEQTRAAEDSDE